MRPPAGRDGRLSPSSFAEYRDWQRFADTYADPDSGIHIANHNLVAFPTITGELAYVDVKAVEHDIVGTKHTLEAAGKPMSDGFMVTASPGSAAHAANAFCENDEVVVWAWVDVLCEEHKHIMDAGLTVQTDALSITKGWDQVSPESFAEDYRAFSRMHIDALNHALEDINPSLARFHVCWGSWHDPHTMDIAFKDIVDLALLVSVSDLTFEMTDAHHMHEWTIRRDIGLSEGRCLIPDAVSHSMNVVEYPRLVAQRIRQLADIMDDERVMVSMDYGLSGRIHPSIAQAKLDTFTESARLMSK